MKVLLSVVSASLLVQLVAAPPPRRNEQAEKQHEEGKDKGEVEDFGLEYNRYLKEVIDLLESDPEFKKKLEHAQEADIRSGQIAKELEFVDHRVRTKLDEVKRQEIERLRHLAQKQYELTNGIETEHVKVSSEHLDHENPHTFEMEDLKKLIAKVSADLNEADERRREEFKEYEMQKEFEKQQKLKHLQGSEREEFEKQLKENETKHKQHEPLHHPGSKQQLEEVWEKQDHMDNQEFDPKVFFQLHDLDGNGFWDHNEVKTLFLKELDKMYKAGAPEDDMKERGEEMERMREHVFSEADRNKDGLISYEEFIEKTKQPDFEKDPGWESLDQKPAFTQEEYLEFERRRLEEVQRMIQQGLIPPQPVFHPGQGYHPQQAQYAQYHQPQYQYPGGHHYPPQAQHPPVRYAQDFPNPPPPPQPQQQQQQQQHGYTNQQGHADSGYRVQQQGYQTNAHEQGQQAHPSQQGYQHPPQGQQAHPSQQGYQHPPQGQQAHPSQQGYQHPPQGQAHPSQQGYQHPPQGQQAHPSQLGYQQPGQGQASYQQNQAPAGEQPGRDPNEVHPEPKYQKDTGNGHPNVIESKQTKPEDHHASKSN